ncbi:pilus assembly protein PilP [Pseudidiomarina terrestris]|uniref:Pilus assembly protein PilP n=1 Tax=Pseudidiomarina terrestris TaxID=2820060 RepID=A0AAW7QZD9_9GAMM|nr:MULTISPECIES: pilus assembly protein PilP [unclassified Pseudidiomarina]MDN7124791.1 pilus assembly protein PilP [Pseudidiomarina sp. 1APP75-32.1]MDN7129735.1 pilus assembly protein PilP [Pseudidiomarina sp. 1APR75-15]MDN7136480.1 pilus assembly protein PilP [Pseudidiomarina sp. 1ASP75-5]MDN7138007.1 pilus assembly protein PilP [Pseudidiomarina sp. 1ASP75-14]MEA3588222.1 pilus assembly protein PilP [Pseudidiomarina sp. 1APP75-27a]
MIKRFSFVLTSALLLTACSQGGHQDLVAYTEQVRSSSVPNAEPLPEMPELQRIDYNGRTFRNPFEPAPLNAPSVGENTKGCPQPNLEREREELESLGLDQFTLVGTMRTNSEGQVALVSTNQGRLYRVAMGDYMGLNLGQITEITSDYIMIAEWVPAGDGCWQRRDTALRLPGSQGSSDL